MIRTPCLAALACVSALSLASGAQARTAPAAPVTPAELRETIAVLASDEYGGREPGTEGETKTLAYIADSWWKAGLRGAADDAGGWYAPVELRQTTPLSSLLALSGADGAAIPLDGRASLGSADGIAFYDRAMGDGVGFDGIVRLTSTTVPEGTDLTGKLVIATAGEDLRAAMGIVGRLAEARPAAVLVVLPDQAAFDRMVASYGRSRVDLAARARERESGVVGIATPAAAAALTRAAGFPEGANESAVRGTIATQNSTRDFTSHNVIAKLPGTDPAAGAVMFTGHWDHIGTCRPAGAADRICNGAVDNASGIAVMTAVAERLAALGPFERTIYFVATTAEEKGLLGAYALADHPPVPLDQIVVALNIDTIAIAERGAKVAIIGRGKTDLDPLVERVARSLGREIDKSDEANAFIKRQDGWALSQRDVPALMVGGSFADQALLGKFLAGAYHGPDDELTAATPLGGAAEDADLHVALGAFFADADRYPAKPPQ